MNTRIEDRIEQVILEAIAERRLPPGTKLGEQALSDMFSCNRANVRRALASLAAQKVIELFPNRGAFVISPSPKEARDIFEARRAIERAMLAAAVDAVTDQDLAALSAIVTEEETAREAGDEPRALRLSSQFHLKLADISGNAVLAQFLADLTTRSALIIGLYGAPARPHCSKDEHARILRALADRDRETLLALMDTHLSHLEADLDFTPKPGKPGTLKDFLFP